MTPSGQQGWQPPGAGRLLLGWHGLFPLMPVSPPHTWTGSYWKLWGGSTVSLTSVVKVGDSRWAHSRPSGNLCHPSEERRACLKSWSWSNPPDLLEPAHVQAAADHVVGSRGPDTWLGLQCGGCQEGGWLRACGLLGMQRKTRAWERLDQVGARLPWGRLST